MLIIRVKGGLGNQMFQYALHESFQAQGKEVKLDINLYDNNYNMKYQLESIFGIKATLASENEIRKVANTSRLLRDRIQRNIWRIITNSYVRDETVGYNKKILTLDNKYLDGYWQSEKYFDKIKDRINEIFTITPDANDNKNRAIIEEMSNSNSVSVHIRDYIDDPDLGGVCDLEYYRRAMEHITNMLNEDEIKFFLFSNNLKQVKQNIKVDNATYVDWNKNEKSYWDMQLMARCKHNIIANSSFSWWGAWLNNNKEKIIIAPEKWTKDRRINRDDIVPSNWIRL